MSEDKNIDKNIDENIDKDFILKKQECKYILDNLHIPTPPYTTITQQQNDSYITHYLFHCSNCSVVNTIIVMHK